MRVVPRGARITVRREPVATFTTDASGNGVLTLANGTQVPIVDWHVVWQRIFHDGEDPADMMVPFATR